MNRKKFPAEFAYVWGMIFLALGSALMARADFGMSMVVAPAYLVYLKVSESLSFFTFGMAEYTLQAVLLIVLGVIMKRFKWAYLFSFVTAVLYGMLLDLNMAATQILAIDGFVPRTVSFVVGLIACAIGVAFMFHTYISAEAYEQFVKEIAAKTGCPINKTKTIYDLTSCGVGILLSFLFYEFGHFEGVKIGTVICALINGTMIGKFSEWMEKRWEFVDLFKFRKIFEP